MADLLLRNVPAKTLDALKMRAKAENVSIGAAAIKILESGVDATLGESVLAWATTVRENVVDYRRAARFVREARDEK